MDSIEFGASVAREINPGGKPRNRDEMAAIAQNFGAKITYSPYKYSTGALAEYNDADKEIICYSAAIAKVEELAGSHRGRLTAVDFPTMCIAHELFHHLDFTRYSQVQLGNITIKYAGIITIRRRVRATREIAAHAFAQELLALPLSPATLLERALGGAHAS